MIRRLTLTTTESHRGMRLDDALAGWLPQALGRPLSKTALRRLIMAGAVSVAGRPLRQAGRSLLPGARLEALVRLDLLPGDGPARDVPFALEPKQVLYEDDALIVVDKPPGLPTQPTVDPQRPSLYGIVKRHLAERGGPEPYLGLHQRLDRDTSGVVLFTKDPAANAGLAAQFAGRSVEKTYHALTRRPPRLPPPSWRVSSRLAAVGRGRARVETVRSGGALAETGFALLETHAGGLVVEARPRTGRKHQIRVHLAEAGLPILGDDLYGAPRTSGAPVVPRLMLHAARLALRHPLSGARIAIESPDPPDFAATLRALRAGRR